MPPCELSDGALLVPELPARGGDVAAAAGADVGVDFASRRMFWNVRTSASTGREKGRPATSL